jgi:acylphosphatase
VSDRRRVRVRVRGLVQGVFFREGTRHAAEQAGVAGWVRNLPDGSVEAVLEGPPAAVERVLGFLRSGPPDAVVSDVEVSEEAPEGPSGFSVR